ncbi:hypothetical protein IT570_01450 [Candidatus Sumerlaeota bacterium]|nr:hypothetical protein [Candidatus Sumerlaeota bacterium]
MRFFFAALMLLLSSISMAGETTPTLTLNTRLRSKLLVDPKLDPQAALRKRLSEGHNIQVLLTIPDAGRRGGPLLDPDSVLVKWKDNPLTSYVYYTTPKTAVLFALFPQGEVAADNKGDIEVSGRLLGSSSPDAGWRLPLQFSADDETSHSIAMAARRGRMIHVQDEDGQPLPGAFVFGQRIHDLLTTADEHGNVMLDAMIRNSSSKHTAWTREHWTSGIDPITTQTLTLVKKDPSRDRKVSFIIKDDRSGPVKDAVILVDETNYYFHYEDGKNVSCVIPRKENSQALVLVAGFSARRVWIPPDEETVIVTMGASPDSQQPPPQQQ